MSLRQLWREHRPATSSLIVYVVVCEIVLWVTWKFTTLGLLGAGFVAVIAGLITLVGLEVSREPR